MLTIERILQEMDDEGQRRPRLFRLVWRWKDSGTTGTGPWTHRGHVVEGWLDSLTRRWGERVDHWIETGTETETAEHDDALRDQRKDERSANARE